jgi:hypothetical protein
MCSGDDHNCPQFRQHRQELLEDLDAERRNFLKSAFVTGGGAAAWVTGNALMSPASAQVRPGRPTHHYLPATADTVHWGYFSKLLKPQLEVDSGDYVTIEALTHHANDDAERMIKGDPGAELPLEQRKERRQPPGRRAYRWQTARPRRGRRFRGPHLHRTSVYPRSRARRHP